MRFPIHDRVIYGRNPLKEVLCQLRFSMLLRIQQELPFEFQEAIREEYPLLEVAEEALAISVSAQGQTSPTVPLTQSQRTYRFFDTERCWQATLNSGFVSLSTRRYTQWEDFRDRLERVVAAFLDIYRWQQPLRVGLRYQDFISRQELGLQDSRWRELFNPALGGPLFDAGIAEDEVLGQEQFTLFRLDDNIGNLRLRHGLAQLSSTSESGYSIDCDAFSDASVGHATIRDIAELRQRLGRFNSEAGAAFRWCIGERLHSALEPRPVVNAAI